MANCIVIVQFDLPKRTELTKRFGAKPWLTWHDTHVTVDNLKGETRFNGKAQAHVN